MKITATIEFELENTFGDSEEELMWLENEILVGDRNLILHSNDVGDTVGIITKVRNIKYSNHETIK